MRWVGGAKGLQRGRDCGSDSPKCARGCKADPYGVNLRLRKSGSKCAVKVFFSKLKMTPYGESENGKYEADVRHFALTIRSIF